MSFAGGFSGLPTGYAASGTPSTQVELAVKCTGLADRDVTSKSDPVCVLSQLSPAKTWLELDRTEQIKDCLSPSWQKKFQLDYRFEERQNLKFSIYDWDGKSSNLKAHDFLGEVECSLGEIMAQQSRGFTRPLKGKSGTISIQGEELSGTKDVVSLGFSGKNLDKKDFLGKSDPFLVISRANPSGDHTVVYRSEVIKSNLNPAWKMITLGVATLCNGDHNRGLRFEVFDADDDGSHDLIGTFTTTLSRLLKGEGADNTYDLINEKKKQKKGSKYTNSGVVKLHALRMEKAHSFLDYIKGGLQVNFTVAIDFTASNGPPSDPRSLHFKDPSGRPNQYTTAIRAIGDIIQDYDSDKMFPGLGFGARIPPRGEVSHEFFLNLDPNNPYCSGVEGVLAAYQRCLQVVQLYGPTNFSPVINHVAKFGQAYVSEPSNYFVLLILTDGIISDFEETKRAIIRASSLPMSIIIVGVGEEDFSAMEMLDADRVALSAGGQSAARDVVQFVELRRFLDKSTGSWDREALARAVLAEIPQQVLSWMRKNSFNPRI